MVFSCAGDSGKNGSQMFCQRCFEYYSILDNLISGDCCLRETSINASNRYARSQRYVLYQYKLFAIQFTAELNFLRRKNVVKILPILQKLNIDLLIQMI